MIEFSGEKTMKVSMESRILINGKDYGRVWDEDNGFRAQFTMQQGGLASFFGRGTTKLEATYAAIETAKIDIQSMIKEVEGLEI